MGTTTSTGTLFKPELVTDMFSKVKGHSTLAKLCGATPVPFAGTDTFVFSMDGEASIVGEGGSKLREIGRLARLDVCKLLDKRVHLEIWVRVKRGWSDNARILKSLGYE